MAHADNSKTAASITTAASATVTAGASRAEAIAVKLAWRKPEVPETACGCEINCYATSTGVRPSS